MLAAGSLPITSGIEPPLKTGPRGYPSDHTRTEFLRWKGAAIVTQYARAAWMHSSEVLDRIRTVWLGAAPLKAWLGAHVGASETPVR